MSGVIAHSDRNTGPHHIMMNTSSIFLSSVTVVDHAFIDASGIIRGMSYNPTFVVTGTVDQHENVVIDFSSVKKELKALIDDRDTGFDHKLWIIAAPDGVGSKVYIAPEVDKQYSKPNGRITVSTAGAQLSVPSDAVRVIELARGQSIVDYWNQYLTDGLSKLHPDIDVKVQTNLGMLMTSLTGSVDVPGRFSFNYIHGLRDSTSFGCQNIAHGHLSYMQILDANFQACTSEEVAEILRRMCFTFGQAVFVWKDNVLDHTSSARYVTVEYTSTNRGRWYARYDRQFYNVRTLLTETTIEHLVEYIAECFRADLKTLVRKHGARYLAISEGLTKGAVLDLAEFFKDGFND